MAQFDFACHQIHLYLYLYLYSPPTESVPHASGHGASVYRARTCVHHARCGVARRAPRERARVDSRVTVRGGGRCGGGWGAWVCAGARERLPWRGHQKKCVNRPIGSLALRPWTVRRRYTCRLFFRIPRRLVRAMNAMFERLVLRQADLKCPHTREWARGSSRCRASARSRRYCACVRAAAMLGLGKHVPHTRTTF